MPQTRGMLARLREHLNRPAKRLRAAWTPTTVDLALARRSLRSVEKKDKKAWPPSNNELYAAKQTLKRPVFKVNPEELRKQATKLKPAHCFTWSEVRTCRKRGCKPPKRYLEGGEKQPEPPNLGFKSATTDADCTRFATIQSMMAASRNELARDIIRHCRTAKAFEGWGEATKVAPVVRIHLRKDLQGGGVEEFAKNFRYPNPGIVLDADTHEDVLNMIVNTFEANVINEIERYNKNGSGLSQNGVERAWLHLTSAGLIRGGAGWIVKPPILENTKYGILNRKPIAKSKAPEQVQKALHSFVQCGPWAIEAALHKQMFCFKGKPSLAEYRKAGDLLNWPGKMRTSAMTINDIARLEKLNKDKVAISVFQWRPTKKDGQLVPGVAPVRVSRNTTAKYAIQLMLVLPEDTEHKEPEKGRLGDREEIVGHFMAMTKKSLSAILYKGDGKRKNAVAHCPHCLHQFSCSTKEQRASAKRKRGAGEDTRQPWEIRRDEHAARCAGANGGEPQIATYPQEGTDAAVLKYTGTKKEHELRFWVVADCEALNRTTLQALGILREDFESEEEFIVTLFKLEPMLRKLFPATSRKYRGNSKIFIQSIASRIGGARTRLDAVQTASSFRALLMDGDKIYDQWNYRLDASSPKDPGQEFLIQMCEWEVEISNLLENRQSDVDKCFDAEARKLYESQTDCCHCGKEITDEDIAEGNYPVRHHDPIDNKFIGKSHNFCNLKDVVQSTIPVVFWNRKGYDDHMMFTALGSDTSIIGNREIKLLAKNEQEYITWSLGRRYEKVILSAQDELDEQGLQKYTHSKKNSHCYNGLTFAQIYSGQHALASVKLKDWLLKHKPNSAVTKYLIKRANAEKTPKFATKTITKHKYRGCKISFIDPMLYYGPTSLDKVAQSLLPVKRDEFKTIEEYRAALRQPDNIAKLKKQFAVVWDQCPNEDKFIDLVQKGHYPYEWVDDPAKFEDTELPTFESGAWFSKVGGVNERTWGKSDTEKLQTAHHVFDKYCEPGTPGAFGRFHDLYEKVDCLMLAAIIISFKKLAREKFDLEPLHFPTGPSLFFQCLLKTAKMVIGGKEVPLQIDRLTDPDMFLHFEEGIAGGLVFNMNRHSVAHYEGMKDYDPKRPTKRIIYQDMNSEYPSIAQHAMPTGGYKWKTPEQAEARFRKVFKWYMASNSKGKQTIHEFFDTLKTGMSYRVDLSYACETCNRQGDRTGQPDTCPDCAALHHKFRSYGLCPQKQRVRWEWMSPGDQADAIASGSYNPKAKDAEFCGGTKLLPTLFDLEGVVVHEKALCFYQRMGLRVTKVYKSIQFEQSCFMKKFIADWVLIRSKATTDFEKDFAKLILNSVCFGKWLVNKRKHRRINAYHASRPQDKRRLQQAYNSPKYAADFEFGDSDQLKFVMMDKKSVYLDTVLPVADAILQGARVILNSVYYDDWLPYWGDQIEALYTDTDSKQALATEGNGRTYLDYIQKHAHKMDLSNYPKGHVLHSNTNKKRLECMKEEQAPMLFKKNGEPTNLVSTIMANTGYDREKATELALQMPSTTTEQMAVTEKVYVLSQLGGDDNVTARGTKRCIIKHDMKTEQFRSCIHDGDSHEYEGYFIQSKAHHVGVYKKIKTGLRRQANKNYGTEIPTDAAELEIKLKGNGLPRHLYGYDPKRKRTPTPDEEARAAKRPRA